MCWVPNPSERVCGDVVLPLLVVAWDACLFCLQVRHLVAYQSTIVSPICENLLWLNLGTRISLQDATGQQTCWTLGERGISARIPSWVFDASLTPTLLRTEKAQAQESSAAVAEEFSSSSTEHSEHSPISISFRLSSILFLALS